jgi:hypothetical protein
MNFSTITPIKVGGFNVKLEDGTQALTYQSLAGTFQGGNNTIYIRTDFCEELQAQSLLHEVGHAIESVYLEADQLSEAQLSAFTQGWFQVLRDNPEFIRAVTGAKIISRVKK